MQELKWYLSEQHNEYMSYAIGHNSFTSQYLLHLLQFLQITCEKNCITNLTAIRPYRVKFWRPSQLSMYGWLIRRVSGWDDWIYCTLYVHTARDYRQYSALAILHTFQSHCNFNSHEIFLAQSNSFLAISSQSPSTAISRTRPNSDSSCVLFSLYSLETDREKTPLHLLLRRHVYSAVA
jgi:hypothetical protein